MYEQASEDQYKSVSKVLMTNASYETTPPAQQAEATVQQENLAVVVRRKAWLYMLSLIVECACQECLVI